jgi:hypothetical protein
LDLLLMEGTASIPYFSVLVGAAAAALVIELLVLRAATQRLGALRAVGRQAAAGQWEAVAAPAVPSRAPELVAALAPLVVAGILAAALQESRDTIMRAPNVDLDPSEKAAMLARGFSGTINGAFFGIPPVALLVALGAAAASLAVAARLHARGLARAVALAPPAPEAAAAWARHPGPAPEVLIGTVLAFLLLGLGPILQAALSTTVDRIKFFGAIAGVDPDMKMELMLQHMNETAARMKMGLLVGRLGVLAAVILGVALAITRSPARARARLLGRSEESPGNGALVLGLVFLVLAGAAFTGARRWQSENDLPWPAADPRAVPLAFDAEASDLDGPDAVDRAPVLRVTAEKVALDGREMEVGQMEEALYTLSSNYRLLHPAGEFNGRLLIACAGDAPVARLWSVLPGARRTDYEHAMLLFVRHQMVDRPLLGARTRTLATGAAFDLITAADQAPQGSTILDRRQVTTCRDLGARLIDLRRQGKNVALVVER